MTRRRRKHRSRPSAHAEVMPYVPLTDPKLDAARRAYMQTPEWWHQLWADAKERT